MYRWAFLLGVLLGVLWSQPVTAWMGAMYRNREAFRPVSNDYDDEPAAAAAGAPIPRTGMWYQQRRSAMDLLQDPSPEFNGCVGTVCRDDAGCCENMLCKFPELDNKKAVATLGTCVPNPNEGVICKEDAACGNGMECALTAGSRGYKTCQPKNRDVARKQYNDDCRHSLECDQSRGLCCQQHRRHRQAPRLSCLYYKDSHNCLGFSKKDYGMDDFIPNNKNRWWQY
ncbi:ITG-like peptide isoform X2 [Paramacrobiotus metropolitanus]|uniref:ITG-like peptide isoform X2 n=1 Tax=Paramacrobiotus metropolitanus TaxID=2943436 RepID=UPI0024464E21|nr:ITG-like peptide isoform X2 [Paramacrobiotus metropolitanus]